MCEDCAARALAAWGAPDLSASAKADEHIGLYIWLALFPSGLDSVSGNGKGNGDDFADEEKEDLRAILADLSGPEPLGDVVKLREMARALEDRLCEIGRRGEERGEGDENMLFTSRTTIEARGAAVERSLEDRQMQEETHQLQGKGNSGCSPNDSRSSSDREEHEEHSPEVCELIEMFPGTAVAVFRRALASSDGSVAGAAEFILDRGLVGASETVLVANTGADQLDFQSKQVIAAQFGREVDHAAENLGAKMTRTQMKKKRSAEAKRMMKAAEYSSCSSQNRYRDGIVVATKGQRYIIETVKDDSQFIAKGLKVKSKGKRGPGTRIV